MRFHWPRKLGEARAKHFSLHLGVLDGRARIEMSRPVVRSPRVPEAFDGYRMAFLSDLHFGPFARTSYFRRILDMVKAERPDVVLFGGDTVDYSPAWARRLEPLLAELAGEFRCLLVVGNHEYYSGIVSMLEVYRRAGIEPLLNRHVLVQRGGNGEAIAVAGMDDVSRGRPDAKAALAGIGRDTFTVILSHCPDMADRIDDGLSGDFMLAGHTHGGQICLFGRALATETRNYRYVRGMVQGPRFPVYISRGLGVTGIPIRLGADPELPIVTLSRG